MATTNVTVTTDWVKLADDTDDPVLIQCAAHAIWEAATLTGIGTPTVSGHQLVGDKVAITRDNIGNGYVYVRVTSQQSATFVVSK